MNIDIVVVSEALGGAITAVGSVYAGAKAIIASSRRKKEVHKQEILKQAKEEMSKIEASLVEKIQKLETEFQFQKENVAKDLDHIKITYNSEIKILGERIQELRSDLSAQHANLVNLLTKLVNSK